MHTSPFAQLHNDLTDHVTGLPRYASALVEIPHLARGQQAEHVLGVITLTINPTPAVLRLTPESTQQLRIEITRLLSSLLKPKDRLYSISHWEWLAVLPDLVSSAPLTMAMIRLESLFNDSIESAGGRLALDVSCGGALWPAHGSDALHLVQSARIARLTATREKTGHAIYDPEMEHMETGELSLHRELQHALAGSPGLSLHLQPQIDLLSGKCIGCEALLRWQRPNGEWISPPRTLAIIERLGLRASFTRWLLQQAMQVLKLLSDAGIAIPISINLSASDLLDAELPDLVAQSLATWEIPPERLLLELTETLMVEETPQVAEVLQRLRAMGLHLSIDDFGTGYAGMSYLQRLPVQEVKIDRSFVCQADASAKDREIIAAIIKLAHRLKMGVIAEGVETTEIAEVIAGLGCDRAQGFLYTAALAAEDMVSWWQANGGKVAPVATKRRRRSNARKAKAA